MSGVYSVRDHPGIPLWFLAEKGLSPDPDQGDQAWAQEPEGLWEGNGGNTIVAWNWILSG